MAYYFVSDTHVGLSLDGVSTGSEARLISWLEEVSRDAEAIFLVGDIFDFWFEYKRVVPKGYVRLLGKLAELTDRGVEIHFFTGNHDMWVRDYFQNECGLIVHTQGQYMELCGKRVYVGHGDGLGNCGVHVSAMQKMFHSNTLRKLFSSLVHPDAALKFGQGWSHSNRVRKNVRHQFRQEDEGVVQFAREYLKTREVDYFVFGHLHCPTEYKLTDESTLFVLGEWIVDENPVYGMLTPLGFSLESYKG